MGSNRAARIAISAELPRAARPPILWVCWLSTAYPEPIGSKNQLCPVAQLGGVFDRKLNWRRIMKLAYIAIASILGTGSKVSRDVKSSAAGQK